jgi:type VI secretion system secreted protein Hcp
MVDGNDAFTTTRRGALKTGALGLGGLTSAIALGGTEAASAAALPSMDTVAALAGVSGGSYFLQLDGIPGDSVDERHLAWIDVESYSWGASNSSAVSGSGWSSSKASISNLNLSTQFGSASPLLFLRTMNGKHVSTAVLQGMTGGDTPRKFLELELKDVAVISYQSSASEGPPFESLSLAFAIIKYTLFLQSATGGVGETISATWNLRTGTGSVA